MKNILLANRNIFIVLMMLLLSSRISYAQGVDSLFIKNTRYIASMPGNYSRSLKVNFKRSTVIGLTGVETYSTLVGLRGWTADNSGGKAYELAFTSGKLFLRSGYTSGWGEWEKILTDNVIKESSNGNVGIGTTTPQSKLAVDGTITAQKVKVTQTGWPDYVFDSTYQLCSLSEIEKFIQQNKHLPDIPSDKEVRGNGLDLGEIQKKQMQKIEEMMLYLIKMNKRQSILEKQVKELKSLNEQLVKQIQNLKVN